MVRLNVGNDEAASVVGGTKMKPESKPPARGSQGLAKADWATVWLPGIPSKTKVTTEPLVTLTDEGTYEAAYVVESGLPWCPGQEPQRRERERRWRWRNASQMVGETE
ncbi:hypothetical protein TRAPUB_7154 [Trametes pubescens]|uniref:Uncharacterized protein n=1 Tax=Trametes pubescens TaxID=154538 RepID=A0A1M2V421_TRAPU|nr:hypothetical protein TRAPUB_7154 [Trametes pubescens]